MQTTVCQNANLVSLLIKQQYYLAPDSGATVLSECRIQDENGHIYKNIQGRYRGNLIRCACARKQTSPSIWKYLFASLHWVMNCL